MKKYKRLGIYGGTFAPVHKGHTCAASAFINCGIIDKLIIMPSFIPPHKKLSFIDDPRARLDMLNIAFREFEKYGDRFEISDYEISKGDVSYTYETVKHYKPLCDKLILLCGSDMLLSFDTWYRAEDLMKMCEVAYISRNANDIGALRKKADELTNNFGLVCHEVPCDINEISSTRIRDMIRKGLDIKDFVDVDVAKFIKENGIYG